MYSSMDVFLFDKRQRRRIEIEPRRGYRQLGLVACSRAGEL